MKQPNTIMQVAAKMLRSLLYCHLVVKSKRWGERQEMFSGLL